MTGNPVRRRDGDLTLALHIQPRAARDEIAGIHGGRIKIRLSAPPADGKANAALIDFLAAEFNVPKKSVEIVAGHAGRRKSVVIHGPPRTPEWLAEAGEE